MEIMLENGEWQGGYVNGEYIDYRAQKKYNEEHKSGNNATPWGGVSLSGGDSEFISNLDIGNDNYPIPTIEMTDFDLENVGGDLPRVVAIIWYMHFYPCRPEEPPFEGVYDDTDHSGGDSAAHNYYNLNYNHYPPQTIKFTGMFSIPVGENDITQIPYVGFYSIQEDGFFKIFCTIEHPEVLGITYCGEVYVLRNEELVLHGPLLPELFEQFPDNSEENYIIGGTNFYLPNAGYNLKVILQIRQLKNKKLEHSEDIQIYEY